MFSASISPHNDAFSGRFESYAGCFLFIVLTLIFLLIFQDYGVTWDEKVQFEYGLRALRYYTSGFEDESCNHFYDLYLYGPLFEMLCAAVYKFIGNSKYEIHHFLISICALLTLVSVYKLSRLIRNSWTPFLSIVILITMPHFFGHAFINPKDIPFACTFSWAMYAVCRLLVLEKARLRDFCLTGMAIGLALSARVGGLLIFIFLAAGILMKLWQRRTFIAPATMCVKTVISAKRLCRNVIRRLQPKNLVFQKIAFIRFFTAFRMTYTHIKHCDTVLKAGIQDWFGCRIKSGMTCLDMFNCRSNNINGSMQFTMGLILLTLIAWSFMVLFWPWTHLHPFSRPFEAFQKITAFPSILPVLFEGRYIASSQLPWYYLPKYFLITTPPFILAFFITGLGVSIFYQVRNARDDKSLIILLVELWFFFPLIYVMCRRPNTYDGIRHFLFLLPSMAIIAAAGVAGIWNVLSKLVPKPWMITVLVVLMLLQPVADMVSLHPYQMTYYNLGVGGTGGADGRYETDYWASSYKEGAEWINKQLAEAQSKRITLVIVSNDYSLECAKYYLDPRVEVFKVWSNHDRLPPAFDYLMATTRYFTYYRFDYLPVVHTVGRQGAAFTVVMRGPNSAYLGVPRGSKM